MKDIAAAIDNSDQVRKHKKNRDSSSKKSRIKIHKRRRGRRGSHSSSSSRSPSPVRRKSLKKLERRKRDKGKSDKKGKGKVRRRRRDSSVSSYSSSSSGWSSGRSCSTCHGGSEESDGGSRRSRSPVVRKSKKGKLRGRSRDRGRSREKRKGGSRYRSLSCSRSLSREHKARTESQRKIRKPSEESFLEAEQPKRLKSSLSREHIARSESQHRSRKPSEESVLEAEQPKHLKSSLSRGHIARSESEHRSQKPSEESVLEAEPPKRLKSVLEVNMPPREEDFRSSSNDHEGADKIIQAYDDIHPPRSYDDDRYNGNRQRELEEDAGKDACFTDNRTFLNKKDRLLSKIDKQFDTDAIDAGREHSKEKEEETLGSLEANDLELLLRKKALENLKKFRGSTNARKNIDREQESNKIMSSKDNVHAIDSKDSVRSIDSKLTNSHENQRVVPGLNQPTELTVKSTIYIHPDKVAPHVNSQQKDHETNKAFFRPAPGIAGSSRIKEVQVKCTKDSSSRSLEQNSQINPEPKTSINDSDKKADVEPVSGVSAPLNIENAVEFKGDDTGSEYQQKTFSRMQGGELVQVNYTVRIPKRTPALARRKLQR